MMWRREDVGDCVFCDMAEDGASVHWQFLLGEEQGTDVLRRGNEYSIALDTAPIVPGHMLVIPKGHYTSMAQVPVSYWPELEDHKGWVKRLLNQKYSESVSFFEHGAGDIVRRAGACVDHAHLHVVPGDYNIEPILRRSYPNLRLFGNQADAFDFFGKQPYIYLENSSGKIYGAEAPECSSQFLRRLFAAAAGKPQRWNWRDCIRLADEMGIRNEIRELKEHASSM